MSKGIREAALAEMQQIESAVFQFGQRVRLFLQALPAGLPQPLSASPALSARDLDEAYLHLTFATPDEVASWASWMGATLKRNDQCNAVFTSAQAVVDGLPLYVGCMTLDGPAEKQEAGQ